MKIKLFINFPTICPATPGMDQHDRDSVIQDFKQGNIRVLVATSVAARGLDIKALRLVVNLDCPNHYEDYVHRVGRTGRAGMKGGSRRGLGANAIPRLSLEL